jgi:hypothetical protein
VVFYFENYDGIRRLNETQRNPESWENCISNACWLAK